MLLLLKSKKEVFTILNRLKYLTKLSLIILVLILLISMANDRFLLPKFPFLFNAMDLNIDVISLLCQCVFRYNKVLDEAYCIFFKKQKRREKKQFSLFRDGIKLHGSLPAIQRVQEELQRHKDLTITLAEQFEFFTTTYF